MDYSRWAYEQLRQTLAETDEWDDAFELLSREVVKRQQEADAKGKPIRCMFCGSHTLDKGVRCLRCHKKVAD